MNYEHNKILNKITKNYKNTKLLLEIFLENYHNISLYIRIDYYPKLKKHKLSWLDLAHYQNNFDSIISYEYMPDDMIIYLKTLISKMNNQSLYQDTLKEQYKISIKSPLLDYNGCKFNLQFNRYLHPEDHLLRDLFLVVFDNLPQKLNCFLAEITAAINGDTAKYEYHDELQFDLLTGNLNLLFKEPIQSRGTEYFEQGRVLFLEQLHNEYLAIVGGKSLYLVLIKCNETTNKIQISCSCPCEFHCKHIYAVITAIRNHKFRPFYKLVPKRVKSTLLERVMNFQFLLSIGIDDQGNNYLVIEDGQIKLLPIINKQGTSDWDILEDDEQETLTKRLATILKK